MEVVFPDNEGNCTITARKCPEGSFVQKDGIIMEYRPVGAEPKSVAKKLRSPGVGVVKFKPGTKRGDTVSPSTVICALEECKHAIVMKDMCATCGRNLREKDGRAGERKVTTAAVVPMIHNVPELVVSSELAKHYGDSDKANCLAARKLVLLVDLDQTVIHTTNRPPLFDITKQDDITAFHLYGGTHWTKLRPYTRQFFKALEPLFEMHIVTFGQRLYAHKIAEASHGSDPIIDPEKKLFSHRILSRDEAFSQHHKTRNLAALFPSGEEMVVIIDDRPDVWEFSEALVQLRPYKYFPDVGDINAPPGNSGGSEIQRRKRKEEEEEEDAKREKETRMQERLAAGLEAEDEEEKVKEEKTRKEEEAKRREDETKTPEDNDEALVHVEKVMKRVHEAFYTHYENTTRVKDVKSIISEIRRSILRDCTIVLSGVVPIGMKQERSDAYRICVQFGATVSNKVDTHTTHVVAARWGTTKVHEAKRTGVPIVTPEWLYACLEQWEKVDERRYLLTEQSANPVGAPLGSNLVPDLATIPIIGHQLVENMNDEVDEALSDENDEGEDEEKEEEEDDDGVMGDDEGFDDDDIEQLTSIPESSTSNGDGVNKGEQKKEGGEEERKGEKRRLCPEARDRDWTGEEEEGDEEDVEGRVKRFRLEEEENGEVDDEEEAEEEEKDDDDFEGRDDLDYGDRDDNEDNEDDEDFDEMAAELEHQLEQ